MILLTNIVYLCLNQGNEITKDSEVLVILDFKEAIIGRDHIGDIGT